MQEKTLGQHRTCVGKAHLPTSDIFSEPSFNLYSKRFKNNKNDEKNNKQSHKSLTNRLVICWQNPAEVGDLEPTLSTSCQLLTVGKCLVGYYVIL